jgi:type I restriction enzyme S subunit
MVGRSGASVGKILTGKSGAYNVALVRVIFDNSCFESRWVFRYLKSPYFQGPLRGISRSAQDGFNKEDLENSPVPLPPLAEQRRIVAKLDALDASSKSARADLDRIPALVARAKQAILSVMFPDIEKKPLSEVTIKIGSGATPRGGRDVYKESGVPFIRSQNVRFEGFDPEGLAHIDDEAAYALRGVETKSGDVLFNVTGASIGRACCLPEPMVGARVSQHVAIIRPANCLDARFLALHLQSPPIQSWVSNENYGVTRQALTKVMIENIRIPVPHLAAQNDIIRRIESAFAKIDRIAVEAASASALLNRLDQALLSKAFRGELVPQDPADEPASELLARIQAARRRAQSQTRAGQRKPHEGADYRRALNERGSRRAEDIGNAQDRLSSARPHRAHPQGERTGGGNRRGDRHAAAPRHARRL